MAMPTLRLNDALGSTASWVRNGVVPGVAVAVARNGALAGEFYAGKQAAGAGRPVDATTLYSIASISKPFTAATLLRLVEHGHVALDEPVRRILPSFDGADKRDIVVRDLLCHTSGLPKDDPAEDALWANEADFATTAASAAALPLAYPPGTRVAYSNAAYWVLGAGIAAIAKASFGEVLAAEVLAHCALFDTYLMPPASVEARIARRYGKAKIMNRPYGRTLGSPSGGLFATARDLVRFASIFIADGRRPDGARVLSSASVEAMTTNQTGDLPGGIEGFRTWPHCPWGLGWEVKGSKSDHWTGDLTSPRTVAHVGQSGALLWADPATGIACAILANRDLYTNWSVAPNRWARISNAIVATMTHDDPG
jgi:CubicO group peptidase (beta-lactamase class C family)